MKFALGTKQIAAIVGSFVAIYFISVHHEALRRWFLKTPPAVQQARGEGWQDGGSGGQPFGPGVPNKFVPFVFMAIGAGGLLLYFLAREFIAPLPKSIGIPGFTNPAYRGEWSPRSSSAGRTPPRRLSGVGV